MRKTLLSIVALASVLASCSQEAPEANQASAVSSEARQVDSQEVRFAEALSRALSADASLRQLIKAEALKRFDNNTDVLYHQMKGLKTSEGKSVRELIQQYWQGSVEDFQKFEAHSPLLNIHLPDLSLFKLASANAWDAQSEEVGVALVRKNEANVPLYVAGDSVAAIASDEIPAIPTLVINQNKRVRVTGSARALNGEITYSYAFLDPSFDGSKSRQSARGEFIDEAPETEVVTTEFLDEVTRKSWRSALTAPSPESQRLSIYYPDGKLDQSVNEQLLRFRIDPKAYGFIADQTSSSHYPKGGDPIIIQGSKVETYRRQKASVDQLIAECWTSGAFIFEFAVVSPRVDGGVDSVMLKRAVSAKELFILNPEVEYRHSTWFRKTKYTYRVKSDRLSSRWVYLPKIGTEYRVRISGPWDLASQATSKRIHVREYDFSSELSTGYEYETEFFVKGELEAGFSLSKAANLIKLKGEVSWKKRKKISYNLTYTQESDDLGSLDLFMTDPILLRKTSEGYLLNNVSNGLIEMTFIPMKTSYRY